MTKDEIVEMFSQDGMTESLKIGNRLKSTEKNEGGSKDDRYQLSDKTTSRITLAK